MLDYSASRVQQISVSKGDTFRLESLRQAVVPPFLMLLPFVELPSFLKLQTEEGLEEDGVHGSRFVILAVAAGEGNLRVGFRDLQTDRITHQKDISVQVR
jgi:hypothetical protein